jgi:hypothetical protein
MGSIGQWLDGIMENFKKTLYLILLSIILSKKQGQKQRKKRKKKNAFEELAL